MLFEQRQGQRLASIVAIVTASCGTIATAAPLTFGPGSLAGYWVNTGSTTLVSGPKVAGVPSFRAPSGELIPLLPSIAMVVEDRRRGREAGKPFPDPDRPSCLTQGMPAVAAPPKPYPLEIIEHPGQITVLLEYYRNFRAIRLNASHLEDPEYTYMGDSIGRWEGGGLTVETTAITEKTNIFGIIPHSDQLLIVEHIRRTGRKTMESNITINDPKTFSKVWTMVSRFKRIGVSNLAEFACGT